MTAPPRCPIRPRSLFVAGDHQFMVEVKFCPWDGKYYATNAQSTSVTHTPPCPLLASPKPWVIHEPLPCETEWPTQAKLTRPSVLMEPFVTATSCMSASAANSLGSDRGVSEYRQLLIYSLIITCLICSTDTMLPFSWSGSAILFCQQFVDWVWQFLGFVCNGQWIKAKEIKAHQNKTEIKNNLNRRVFRCTLFNHGVSISASANSRLFHRSAHRSEKIHELLREWIITEW